MKTPMSNYSGPVVVDPLTRIEGHLRIEVEVENGKVKDARSCGTLFRGLELILKGRDPRDVQHFTQRTCGVCTYTHALASTRALEDAVYNADNSFRIPDNATHIRNLVLAQLYMHDHIVHFYHLHALDFVDVVSALKDGNLCTYELPEGEHVIELTCRMPFPDGCGGQVTNWCRLYLHLREKGALHYGEEANSEIRDSFDISLGFRFSDDCMLGMSISVFEEETFGLAEYSFELPTKDFEYFGKYVLTSGYALYILGDQADVSEAIHMLDVRGESVTSRELAKGEPDAPILYVPVVGEGEDGAVDYMLGRKPYQFGTWPYVRQVSSVGVLGAKAWSVFPTSSSSRWFSWLSSSTPRRSSSVTSYLGACTGRAGGGVFWVACPSCRWTSTRFVTGGSRRVCASLATTCAASCSRRPMT